MPRVDLVRLFAQVLLFASIGNSFCPTRRWSPTATWGTQPTNPSLSFSNDFLSVASLGSKTGLPWKQPFRSTSTDEDAQPSTDSTAAEILPSNPKYSTCGPVGKGNFTLSRLGPPVKEELSNENLLKILMIECSDLEVNTLVWKCLGYRFDPEAQRWTNEECFPKWREKYPDPPDLIGMQRIYTKEIDQPSLKSNQALVRSVPVDNKQSLKTHLKPYGFKGYQYSELTPNKTRRAQCANWLLYYREELFGFSVEELRERRRVKQEEAERQKRLREERGEDEEWSPPVKEVF